MACRQSSAVGENVERVSEALESELILLVLRAAGMPWGRGSVGMCLYFRAFRRHASGCCVLLRACFAVQRLHQAPLS